MEKLNRGDKIYLDLEEKRESLVNAFLSCRDGIVEMYEYHDESGYGNPTRLFLCENTKHEIINIIRQTRGSLHKQWHEECMAFDSDSFEFMKALIKGETEKSGGKYTLVRDYNERFKS